MSWLGRQFRKTSENVKVASIMSRPMSLVYSIIIIIVAAAVIFAVYRGGVWIYDYFTGKTGEPVSVEQNGQNEQGDFSEVGSGESTDGVEVEVTDDVDQELQEDLQNEEVIGPEIIDETGPEITPETGPVVPNTGPQPE
jgi:hypothetical protein